MSSVLNFNWLSPSLPIAKPEFNIDVIPVCAGVTLILVEPAVIPVPAPTLITELESSKPSPANKLAKEDIVVNCYVDPS